MPLKPGSSNAVIGHNIRELKRNGTRPRSRKQIVAIALDNARRNPKAHGGSLPMIPVDRPSPLPSVRSGFIHSDVPGRTDRLPMAVPAGAHVIPADTLSGLGEGNSLAGKSIMENLLSMTKPNVPKTGFAQGGATPDGGAKEIIAAGGEMIVSPEQVRALGQGDQKRGHDYLDKIILAVRRHTAKQLKSLPGPKK
jgi:hypothetical protein